MGKRRWVRGKSRMWGPVGGPRVVGEGSEGGVDDGNCRISRMIEEGSELSSRKEYDGGSLGVTDPNGKMDSSKVTWREIMMRLVERSRQRKPRWNDGYSRKTHGELRGDNLWGVVRWG